MRTANFGFTFRGIGEIEWNEIGVRPNKNTDLKHAQTNKQNRKRTEDK